MTTLGIEWETTALVSIGDGDGLLPEGVYEKIPFFRFPLDHPLFSLTLEGSTYKKDKDLDIDDEADCNYVIECQLGVYRDDSVNQFKLEDLKKGCSTFMIYWNKIIESHSIIINDVDYPIMAHISEENFVKGETLYKTCRGPQIEVSESELNKYAYTSVLKDAVVGKPQITVGIKLHKMVWLFEYITNMYNICEVSGCPEILNDPEGIKKIKIAYDKTVENMKSIKTGNLNQEQYFNLAALILITNMYLIAITIRLVHPTPFKFLFPIKLRTNFLQIVQRIIPENVQEMYTIWFDKEHKDAETGAGTYPSVSFDEWLRITSVEDYDDADYNCYTIVPYPGVISYLPSLGYFLIHNDNKKNCEQQATLTPVQVGVSSHVTIPFVDFYPGEGFKFVNRSGVFQIDTMEWVPDLLGDLIALEIRTVRSLDNMIGGSKVRISKPKWYELEGVESEKLCDLLEHITENMLNPCIQNEPKLLISARNMGVD